MSARRATTVIALVLTLIACVARAQTEADLAREAARAFSQGDLARAAELWQRQSDSAPDNFVPHYNLAVVHTLLADEPELVRATAHLVRAIELGFTDLARVERDDRLAPLRQTPTYQRIAGAWPEILGARKDATIEAWKARLGPRYRYSEHADRRVVAISPPRAVAPDELAAQLILTEKLARRVLGESALEADERTPWVFVIVLEPADYAGWIAGERGIDDPGQAVALAQRLAGLYDHDAKRLVSRDAGPTLRHEYYHALHHRQLDRLGKDRPPPWILEGLACLAESLDDEGNPLPTDRLDIVRRRARANRLTPIAELAAMDTQAFESRRALANYAQSYAAWLYLAERGVAGATYESYLREQAQDPSGSAAVDAHAPAGDLDAALRASLRNRR